MKQKIVKLVLGGLVLILFLISCIAILYPDYSTNEYNYYFIATAQLELCDKEGNNIEAVTDVLVKEAMATTIKEMNIHMISSALKNIDYDTKINFNEASDSLSVNIDDRNLTMTVISYDNEYASKMVNEIAQQLVTDGHWGAPNFYFNMSKPIEMERHLTTKGFLDRQMGEEITVAFFAIVWIGVLGIILRGEVKKGKPKNAVNKK